MIDSTTLGIVIDENKITIKYYLNGFNTLLGWFVYHYKDETVFSHKEHFGHLEIPRLVSPLISDELNKLTKQELINYINLFTIVNNMKPMPN